MQSGKSPERIVAEFKAKRLRQALLAIPVVIGVVGAFLAEGNPDGLYGIPEKAALVICAVLVFGAMILSFINWRCPACKGYLGKDFSPDSCEKCGVPLK